MNPVMRREPATFDLDLRSFGRPADARARGHKMRRLSYYDLTTLSSYRMCVSFLELECEDGLETVVLPIESLTLCVLINL